MKRTLRRESKAPETVGREAMDAGDPLLEAIYGARVGARRVVANRYRSASVCCHVAGRRKAFGGVVGGCPSLSVVPCVRCGRGPGDGPAPFRLVAEGWRAFFQRARGWVSIPTCEAGLSVRTIGRSVSRCVRPLGGGLGRRWALSGGDRQPVLV